jgi:hypothetical protein
MSASSGLGIAEGDPSPIEITSVCTWRLEWLPDKRLALRRINQP